MKKDTFANRLQIALNKKHFKQIDLVNKTGLDKTLINKYLSGISEPKQDKLEIIAKSLDVNEVWLMGYDVPMEKDNLESKNPLEEVLKDIEYKEIKDFVEWDKENGGKLLTLFDFDDIISVFWKKTLDILIKICETNEALYAMKNTLMDSEYKLGTSETLDKVINVASDFQDKKVKLLVSIYNLYSEDELIDIFAKNDNFKITNSKTGKKITNHSKRKEVIKNYIYRYIEDLENQDENKSN